MENIVSGSSLNRINYYVERNNQIKSIIDTLSKIRLTLMVMRLANPKVKKTELFSIIKKEERQADIQVRKEIDSAFEEYEIGSPTNTNSDISTQNHVDSGEAKGSSYTKRNGHYNSSNISSE